jgi:hypothetical protein
MKYSELRDGDLFIDVFPDGTHRYCMILGHGEKGYDVRFTMWNVQSGDQFTVTYPAHEDIAPLGDYSWTVIRRGEIIAQWTKEW